MPAPHSKHRKTRDTKTLKRKSHEKDERVLDAAKDVAKEQAALEKRLAWQARQEAILRAQREREALEREVAGRWAAAEAEKAAIERAAQLREQYSLGEARQQVRDGYSPAKVSRLTGWPVRDLEDVVAYS